MIRVIQGWRGWTLRTWRSPGLAGPVMVAPPCGGDSPRVPGAAGQETGMQARSRSSAATAATIRTWITASSRLACSRSAGPMRVPRALPPV